MANILSLPDLAGLFRRHRPVAGLFPGPVGALCRCGAWIMAAGLACHTLALISGTWVYGDLPAATFGEALLVFDWVLVAPFLLFIGAIPSGSWGPWWRPWRP